MKMWHCYLISGNVPKQKLLSINLIKIIIKKMNPPIFVFLPILRRKFLLTPLENLVTPQIDQNTLKINSVYITYVDGQLG
jgi:hypothetical protein